MVDEHIAEIDVVSADHMHRSVLHKHMQPEVQHGERGAAFEGSLAITPEEQLTLARSAERAVSCRVLPVLLLVVMVSFIDRTNLSFASITMNRDLGLSPSTFGLGAGMFSLGYALGQIPSNVVLLWLGAPAWLAVLCVAWGVTAGAFAFVGSATAFVMLRLLLGLCESGSVPGVWAVVGQLYPPDRSTLPLVVIETGITASQVLGAPLAAGLLAMDGVAGLAGWQWVFLAEAAPAVLMAGAVARLVPRSLASASFLSRQQREGLESAMLVAAGESNGPPTGQNGGPGPHSVQEEWSAGARSRDDGVLGIDQRLAPSPHLLVSPGGVSLRISTTAAGDSTHVSSKRPQPRPAGKADLGAPATSAAVDGGSVSGSGGWRPSKFIAGAGERQLLLRDDTGGAETEEQGTGGGPAAEQQLLLSPSRAAHSSSSAWAHSCGARGASHRHHSGLTDGHPLSPVHSAALDGGSSSLFVMPGDRGGGGGSGGISSGPGAIAATSSGGGRQHQHDALSLQSVMAAVRSPIVLYAGAWRILHDIGGYGLLFFTPLIILSMEGGPEGAEGTGTSGETGSGAGDSRGSRGSSSISVGDGGGGGSSAAHVALLATVPYFVTSVIHLINGYHSQTTKEHRLHLGLCWACGAAALGLLPLAMARGSPRAAFALLVLAHVGVNGANGVQTAYVSSFMAEGQGRTVGLAAYNTLGQLGGFIGPCAVGAMRQHSGGYGWALAVMGGCLAAAAAMVVALSESWARGGPWRTPGEGGGGEVGRGLASLGNGRGRRRRGWRHQGQGVGSPGGGDGDAEDTGELIRHRQHSPAPEPEQRRRGGAPLPDTRSPAGGRHGRRK